MITTNRVILVASKITMNNSNFEAIKPIQTLGEVSQVWRCNKTPIILKENIGDFQNYPLLCISPNVTTVTEFIDFCHSHGIECGEFCEQTRYPTSKEDCFLCKIGEHLGYSTYQMFNQFTPNLHDIVVYQSLNFTVKVELGCITKGLMMINHKTHILSAAQIPPKQMGEYHQVMRDIEFLLKSVYGNNKPVIFFEHGMDPSGFSSHKRSVAHQHTHVTIGVKFEQKYLDMVCLKPIDDICKLKNVKYFSYQEGTDGQLMAVWDPEVYVQRQYPRQIIGMILGIDNAKSNWRNEPFLDNLTQTLYDFYEFLSTNRNLLSPRIIQATDCFTKGFPLRADF